jgi:integral membrane sensor domain MASE1
MTAASILIIVVAPLCVTLIVMFAILWAALHFGVGEDEGD